jgi:hypothetical protein
VASEQGGDILGLVGRYADIVVLVAALPVFIFGGHPILGWLAIAIAWPAQRVLQSVLERRAAETDDTRAFFRYMAGSLIGRSWLIALTIFAVGIIDRPTGFAAAVLALIVFTTYLVVSLLFNRPKAATK